MLKVIVRYILPKLIKIELICFVFTNIVDFEFTVNILIYLDRSSSGNIVKGIIIVIICFIL